MSEKLTDYVLQYRLIYSIIVAGKTAKFAEEAMGRLCPQVATPFKFIESTIASGELEKVLRQARTGRYRLFLRALPELIKIDPRTCSVEDLEAIPGIGAKTSRFFLLWTRPGIRVAALDTHILKWLRAQGYTAPKSTPSSGPTYRKLEQIFIAEADKRGILPRDFDYAVWSMYAYKLCDRINKP